MTAHHKLARTTLGLSPTSTTRKARRQLITPRLGKLIESLENRVFLSASPVTASTNHHHHTQASTATAAASAAPAATTTPTAATASVVTSAASAAPAATVTNPIAGDANSDGVVDINDYKQFVGNYNQITTGATWAQGDFNGDGAVNYADVLLFQANFGKTGGTSSGGTSSGSITPVLSAAPSSINWSSPLVITQGGTYTGNWQSTSADTPAVQVNTTQPVIILNANIQSRGNLIVTSVSHANVTIKGTHGWALNPNVSGRSPGRFLNAENFDNLDIENNTMAGTAGIEMGYYAGNGTASNTVKVLKNNALNIDGRYSDGNGGFQTGPDANDYVQFAQFNQCFNMTGVEIAWNQVVNQPGQSRPEDNISVFQSSGTTASPILIHDNYIQGAYPADPVNDNSFTGGGIMLSDGFNSSGANITGNVQAFNNTIISTSNYGIAISSGHNNTIYNNTVVSSGLLPSGQKIASQNIGIYIWNQSSDPNWANNQEYGNTIGWMGTSGRNDTWTPNASGQTGDTALPGTITLSVEQSYYNVWAQKVSASGFTIGA
ncbi:MAG TPA: dockerin type I domain-containing protein [Tepidisphaeraceae bacterium]